MSPAARLDWEIFIPVNNLLLLLQKAPAERQCSGAHTTQRQRAKANVVCNLTLTQSAGTFYEPTQKGPCWPCEQRLNILFISRSRVTVKV